MSHRKPYQEACLYALNARTCDRVIAALPTGTGKGWVAGEIPEWIDRSSALFLAHTDELVSQLYEHVARVHGRMSVSVEMAKDRAAPHTPFVIASVPTLAARKGRRLERLGTDRFGCVVVDEAHHATAATYLSVWAHHGILEAHEDEKGKTIYRKHDSPSVPLIGLTATPGRGDNVGLSNVFDDIAYQLKLKEAIDQGWLVPIRAWTVETKVDLSGVKIRRGDFVQADLVPRCATPERDELIVRRWMEVAAGRKTLSFAVNIAHAKQQAAIWSQLAGVEARWVAGDGPGGMKMDERRAVMRWFGETPGAVLTNVQVATEGVDVPSVECVVMTRPTRSATLYAQCIGRGTRLAPGSWDIAESIANGKSEVLLLDASDSGLGVAQRAVNICDIYGAPIPTEPMDGSRTMSGVCSVQEERVQKQLSGELKDLALFAGAPAPSYCRMQWHSHGASYELPLPGGRVVKVDSDVLERWQAKVLEKGAWKPIVEAGEQRTVLEAAERWVTESAGESLILVDRKAPWRAARPSRKQLALCARFGLATPEGATRGQVSDALDRYFASRRKR